MDKRTLGTYYTPKYLADAIIENAILTGQETLIDPSFGGCVFIESAVKRMIRLGNNNPNKHIYGSDIDPTAFDYLLSSKIKFIRDNFFDNDFLDQKFPLKFDIVIGNPPYIKHDHIPKQARLRAKKLLESNTEIDVIKPNYWFYFIIKALSILKNNGSIFFILPQSFYTSGYSKVLLDYLKGNFRSIDILPINEQVFQGTSEVVCIAILREFVPNSIKCEPRLHKSIPGSSVNSVLRSILLDSKFNLEDSIDFIDSIRENYNLPIISDIADVKIGTVTGYKNYFIINRDKAKKIGIPIKFLKPVISDASDLDKISSGRDIDMLPLMLCIPQSYTMDGLYKDDNLNDYLLAAPDKAKFSYHAINRSPWYSLRLTRTPQAFIKNLSRGAHYIYANRKDLLCTNNILGIYNSKLDIDVLECVSLSKLFSLSAGILAMNYGRKAKKLDPRHVKSIIVPINEEIIVQLKELLRTSNGKYSSSEVDQIIYKCLKIDRDMISRINDILKIINN